VISTGPAGFSITIVATKTVIVETRAGDRREWS
jgi:hypothetical protein